LDRVLGVVVRHPADGQEVGSRARVGDPRYLGHGGGKHSPGALHETRRVAHGDSPRDRQKFFTISRQLPRRDIRATLRIKPVGCAGHPHLMQS